MTRKLARGPLPRTLPKLTQSLSLPHATRLPAGAILSLAELTLRSLRRLSAC
jgi:hypothetical protein